MDARYDLEGRGSDLAITVRGPDPASCLAAAIEGFAASLAAVGPDIDRRRDTIAFHAEDHAELLLELMDEAILRLDTDGELAVGLDVIRCEGASCTGTLELVRLADVTVHGDPPKAATWHNLRLEETPQAWVGYVMLDL